jgi:hypothetical protein
VLTAGGAILLNEEEIGMGNVGGSGFYALWKNDDKVNEIKPLPYFDI